MCLEWKNYLRGRKPFENTEIIELTMPEEFKSTRGKFREKDDHFRY